MTKQTQEPGGPGRLILTAAIGWALWRYPPGDYPDPAHLWLWRFGLLCFALEAVKSLGAFGKILRAARDLMQALGPDAAHGTAGFMSEREARKLGLHRRREGSRFAGIVGRTAIWLYTETHHLILGPAGSSKTTAAIMNILCGCPESALITDIKGELWAVTAEFRWKAFGHRCVKLDPKDPENSVKVNPLDPVARTLEANDPRSLTLVRGMALQLLPDPEGGGGANDVFYKGGRSQLATVFVAVCEAMPPELRTLATAYRVLSDLELLEATLDAASRSEALNGELADMARTMHSAFFGDGANAKTAESFRVNALLALEPFGPGNYLARISSETTFEFAELKESPTSLYILIDYANSEVLAQFSGLMQWMAADAMVSAGNNKPVLFVLDEFCNAPLRTLPKILTLLRSAGVKCILATQDLDDIVRVYSKHALETVLSESHIKQILGGIRSKTTLEYFSAYMGEYSEFAPSWGLGGPQVSQTLGRKGRRLLTEDELRRLPDDAQIIFHGNAKPILAKKAPVFAIDPWRSRIGINRLYGDARRLLPVEVKVRRGDAVVTRHGRRAHDRMARAVIRRAPNPALFALRHLAKVLAPGAVVLGLLAGLAALGSGLPNLRWEYAYLARTTPTVYVRCRYVGPTSPGIVQGPDCPLILWRKAD